MRKWPYHILAIAIVAVWGVTFVSTKELILAGLNPAQIYVLRFLIAYAGIWIIQFFSGKTRLWSNSLKDELAILLLGIFGGSAYFLAENTALAYTQACNVSFIVCTAPLWTLLLTILIRKVSKGKMAQGQESVRFGVPLFAGIALTFAGMAAVIFENVSTLHLSPLGDLLSLAAAITWAIYSVIMGPVIKIYDSLLVTRKVFFYGLVTMIPFLLFTSFETVIPSTEALSLPVVWGNILFLGIAASLLCFVGWNIVIARIGNVTSTNYVYLNPFFTLAFAVAFLGEHLTPVSIAGSLAIVLGIILASKK